jgi:prepilin-type N-terminal cleavage/methylation domain-containing protein
MNPTDRRASHRLAGQHGFSMVETLVALGIFALTAGTMGNYLVQQIRLSSTNYLYTQAYALAEEQLEATRALRYNDMVGGSKTAAIGGATFVVATEIQDDVPANGLKQIKVDVTWSDEQGLKNVAVQTIYTEVQRY